MFQILSGSTPAVAPNITHKSVFSERSSFVDAPHHPGTSPSSRQHPPHHSTGSRYGGGGVGGLNGQVSMGGDARYNRYEYPASPSRRHNHLSSPTSSSAGGSHHNFSPHEHEKQHPGSHKKRSRRRRKGKSRSKVEPLSVAAAEACQSSPKKTGPLYSSSIANASANAANAKKHHDAPMTKRDLYFALDCEMVGVGQDGLTSAVGRVTIVNWENQIVLDTYVRVPTPVTDYRTHVSGITPEHLQPRPGHSLMTFSEVREQVQTILRGKILIGHALENDLKALGLYHPWTDIRDTATYSYYMRQFRDPVTQLVAFVPKKLRDLAWEKLGRQIQNPGVPHCPMEDAIAALDLYKEVRGQWEDHLIRVAQQKDEEQARQLMERRQEQQLQQRQQQDQQQLQQMRRFQWLGAPSAASQQPPMYPGHQQQPVMMMASPPSSSSYHQYPNGGSPMMMSPVHSPAAASYLQGPPPPRTPQQQQPSMRSSGSSWFGFSRRPKNGSRHNANYNIPPSMSHDSVATVGTMTTIQSSFSQDHSPGYSPQQGGAWHIREELADQHQVDMEASHEAILEEPAEPTVLVGCAEVLKMKNDADCSDVATTSDKSVTGEDESPPPLPTDYEPPRYFANPDPEPMSSSSWFKLLRSSKSSKAQQQEANNKGEEYKYDSETEDVSTSSYSLGLGLLFPRRNSEGHLMQLAEKERAISKSLH